MTVIVYRSDDVGAPTFNNAAGELVKILDACLVNGYGAKTAAGWTKAYSGTNKAAYQQGNKSGYANRYVRVVDTAATAYGYARGFITMTDVDTGTGPFPSDAQRPHTDGVYWHKPASATNRPWLLVADERTFYFVASLAETAFENSTLAHISFGFGDYDSFDAADVHNAFICGHVNTNTAGSGLFCKFGTNFAAQQGLYLSHTYEGVAASVSYMHMALGTSTTGFTGESSGSITGPALNGGHIMMHKPIIRESVTVARGTYRGLYNTSMYPGNTWDTFSGSGELAGKEFIIVQGGNNSGMACRFILETSDTWS